jgi:hypothetical protein
MKLITTALAWAFVISSTFAFAHPVRINGAVQTHHAYRERARPVILHPNYGNPNGAADGPTTLSGIGSSSHGGSSSGTSGYS